MNITAAMVKELREKTDAPMMQCKGALVEAEGDMARAEEILRVKLGNKASKAAGRVTAEGLVAVYISDDKKQGAIVEVNCETDFVSKNDDFIAFVNDLAKLVTEANPADVAALNETAFRDGTVESVRVALVGKIGENMTVRRFKRFETAGQLANYIHGTRIGVLVDFVGQEPVGTDLAMHIAASKPKAITSEQVPAEEVEKERSVAMEKAKEQGKPEDIAKRMVEGSVAKFLKEVSLLNQPFVKNPDQTVEAMLKGNGAQINEFVLFVVGEGIQKKETDFAKEVAEAAAGA